MKKLIIILLLGCLWFGIRNLPSRTAHLEPQGETCASESLTSTPSSLSGHFAGNPRRNIAEKGVLNPESLLESFRGKWQIAEYHEVSSTVSEFPLGKTIVYHFSQDSIPIIGMSIRVRVGTNGEVFEEENSYRPIEKTLIAEGNGKARIQALQKESSRYRWVNNSDQDPRVILVRDGLSQGELALSLEAIDKMRGERPTQLILRAVDGKLLKRTFAYSEF
ncbi:MAG: hypothetical protein EB078_02970 [Proteobacteria bacterium]|nr:hypothetical protein [Pseudomonadota bacterium]NDC24166.1 hypothetical protein [Pseudomonadota bacterium]NDD03845.1 hypothetical protein [Pseudomonadota bacterium]NDG25583.1 hypothetical protein [Pseudomonadota bacterium]